MLNQAATNDDAKPIATTSGDAIERFTDALGFRAQWFRIFWLDSEYVDRELSRFDQELRNWLLAKYSLTDLKILLRNVVNARYEGIDRYKDAKDGDHIPSPPENTIRHRPWLLESLVFWTQFYDPRDALLLSRGLRQTQKSRLGNLPGDRLVSVSENEVRSGIEMLEKRKLKEAEEYFAQAIRQDRNKARAGFLALYPGSLRERLPQSLVKRCEYPKLAFYSLEERTFLEDLMADSPPHWESGKLLQNKLCLFHSYKIEYRPRKRMALLKDLLAEIPSQGNWNADFSTDFAIAVLKGFDPINDPKDILIRTRDLLRQAIRQLESERSFKAFQDLQDICLDSGPKLWCWETLKELAELLPDGNIPLQLAYLLSQKIRRDDLLLAIDLSSRAEKNTRNSVELSPENRAWQMDFIRYSRASAYSHLGWLDDKNYLEEAAQEFSKLTDSPAVGDLSQFELASILKGLGRFDDALSVIDAALEKSPRDPNLYNTKLLALLGKQDLIAVTALADEVMVKEIGESYALFIASLAQILTGHGEWEHTARKFLNTDHHYKEFIAMLLYGYMAGEAISEADVLLEERWAQIDPTTWEQRLREGDELVWQEMLIGYFKGKIPRSDIFAVLEDPEAFAKSGFWYLPFPRPAMMCEAYFYDAILAKAHGNNQRMLESLRRAVDTGYGRYIEYTLAEFLIGREAEIQEDGKS